MQLPAGGSVTPRCVHPKQLVSSGEGGGGGRRAGAQISWSVLRLTPGPEEDLTGDEHLS